MSSTNKFCPDCKYYRAPDFTLDGGKYLFREPTYYEPKCYHPESFDQLEYLTTKNEQRSAPTIKTARVTFCGISGKFYVAK